MVIRPSKSASLNITWTDIWGVLGDALPATNRLHIVCSKPERLARLYMAEEAEYLGVGQSCVEGGLFNNAETVSGERKTRESLHALKKSTRTPLKKRLLFGRSPTKTLRTTLGIRPRFPPPGA
jgi:hypothetical protein